MKLDNQIYTTKIEKQTRFLFFIALSICLFGQLLYFSWWSGRLIGNYISYFGLMILIPRFVAVLGAMRSFHTLLIISLSPFILLTCYNVIEKINILLPFAFAISAKNVKFKLIIKFFFVINLSFLIISLLGSQIGLVEDRVIERDVVDVIGEATGDEVDRHAFGYGWVTAFPAHVTYLWVMWFYLRKGFFKIFDYLLLLFSMWFVFYFCNARMETVCMIMLIFLSFYFRLRAVAGKLTIFENLYFKLSVPLYAAIMIFLTYQYRVDGGELYQIVNIVASGRLYYGSDAMFSLGIPIFGQPFVQMGGESSGNAYNFIDCSYLVWLIIYGVYFFTLAIISLTSICFRSISSKDYLLAIIMSLLALQGSIVSVFLNFAYNPFFMALFAKWTNSANKFKSSTIRKTFEYSDI